MKILIMWNRVFQQSELSALRVHLCRSTTTCLWLSAFYFVSTHEREVYLRIHTRGKYTYVYVQYMLAGVRTSVPPSLSNSVLNDENVAFMIIAVFHGLVNAQASLVYILLVFYIIKLGSYVFSIIHRIVEASQSLTSRTSLI